MIGKNGNFLKAHYDWIAAAVALVALVAGGVVFFGSLGSDSDALSAEKVAQVKRAMPGGEPVQTADLTDFTRVSKVAKNPTSLAGVTDDKGSFLAPEARILCTNANCQAAIAKGTNVCPVCKAVLEEAKPEDKDADGDGMPNDWERKYKLNPKDPADAALDADGDGFTNLEEYEAKTDPTDKNSHPDYLESLTIQLPLKETTMPFVFTGTYKTPGGLKFQFKDPSRANEYDRGVYSLLAGAEIGKTGFAPKTLVEKTTERKIGGGMTKKVDASEAIVVRKSDGKEIAMGVGRKQVPIDIQAKLVFTRGGKKEFNVIKGDSIDLCGEKYRVKEIKRTEKGATVVLEHAKLGKIRVLTAP